MKIEQIAFGVASKQKWDEIAKSMEVIDKVEYEGFMSYGGAIYPIHGFANLAFEYSLGFEREYLHYEDVEKSFHNLIDYKIRFNNAGLYLSHFASHVDSIDYYLSATSPADRGNVVMDIRTTSHTSEHLVKNGRKYRYVILDQRAKNGYFFKLIQRIEKPGPNPASSS